MYWQYKYYSDITTCTPEGEALYNNNGTVSENKLRVLSRTYPMAVAGTLSSYNFRVELAGLFTMEYLPWVTSSAEYSTSTASSRTSILYYNEELYYSKGVHVQVKYNSVSSGDTIDEDALPDASKVDIICHEHQAIFLTHSNTYTEHTQDISVKVTLTPCVTDNRLICTCSSK